MSHVNLINKISTKNIEISVFNPFIEKVPNNTFLKIKFLKILILRLMLKLLT